MSRQLIAGGFAVGVIVLALAFGVPQLIDATQTDAQASFNLTVGESSNATETLAVEAKAVNATADNATIELTDLRSLDTNSTTLNGSETDSVSLSGDTISVELRSTAGNASLLTVTYPPMFAWDDSARTVMENLDVVFVLVVVLAILAVVMLWGGIKDI